MIDSPPPLDGWDDAYLEATEDIICIVDEDLNIRWTNRAWRNFAEENGGDPEVIDEWSGDVSYVDALCTPLYGPFLRRWQRCHLSDAPVSHSYECSSPSVFREFRQTLYPLSDGGAVIVNSLVVARPHQGRDPLEPESDASYRDEAGFVRQCAECRRVRHGEHVRWDWIPLWVGEPRERTSFVLCPPCFDRYSENEATAA